MGTDKREKEIYAQSCYKQQRSGVGERGKVRKLRGREPSHPCSEYKEPSGRKSKGSERAEHMHHRDTYVLLFTSLTASCTIANHCRLVLRLFCTLSILAPSLRPSILRMDLISGASVTCIDDAEEMEAMLGQAESVGRSVPGGARSFGGLVKIS
jgi:hypothetical protein